MSGRAANPFDAAISTQERTFDKPWQAEAFALTVQLHENGVFSWAEWSAALGSEIAQRGEADYFACWLNAIETLVDRKGIASRKQLADTRAAWREAYTRTPHGQPVHL